MNERRASGWIALLPWSLCACVSAAATEVPGLYGDAVPTGDESGASGAGSPASLYAWDGSVVEGPASGQVSQQATPGHGLEPTIEGRMHILELYQAVLDERDALAAEVKALTAALEKSEADLDQGRSASAELETKLAAAERAKDALLEQNLELSGRLTTAQIRRLEAEKLLLETRIAWQREKSPERLPVEEH